MSIFVYRSVENNLKPAHKVEHYKTIAPPSIALCCHYCKPEQTRTALESLLKFNPRIKRIVLVDTSEAQDAPKDIPMCTMLSMPNGLHSDGVNFGLKHIQRTHTRAKDKRVLLIDSDVEFTAAIPDVPEATLAGKVIDKRKRERGWLSSNPRIHPCFCVIDFGFLREHGIQFMDWSRISDDNKLLLGHDPKTEVLANPEFQKAKERQYATNGPAWYDVGGTMYEDVEKAGGVIVDFDWGGFMKHLGGGSWR